MRNDKLLPKRNIVQSETYTQNWTFTGGHNIIKILNNNCQYMTRVTGRLEVLIATDKIID